MWRLGIRQRRAKRKDWQPAQRRRHMGQDRLDNMGIVINAKLVGHREQQRVGRGDCFVL